MLRPRVIPCLLISNGGLVKTVRFSDPKYVGDPLNAVRIFNEKQVDELMVLDIDATSERREPDYKLIASLAAECRMPLSYGGGVSSVDQFQRIIELGVEKVAISTAAIRNPDLISHAAEKVGSQSVAVVLDVGATKAGFEIRLQRGKEPSGQDPVTFAMEAQRRGAGELVINNIDRDGTGAGYDHDLIRAVRENVSLPMTVVGGAGSYSDIKALFESFGLIGAAAGSLFVFKGKYKAVLISYPTIDEKKALQQSR